MIQNLEKDLFLIMTNIIARNMICPQVIIPQEDFIIELNYFLTKLTKKI